MSICVVFLPSIFRLISVVRGDEREDKDLVGHEFPWLSASIRSKMTTCDSASQACTRLSEYFAKELVMGVLSQVHVCQQAFIGARSNVRPQKSHYYSNNAFCSHDFYLFVCVKLNLVMLATPTNASFTPSGATSVFNLLLGKGYFMLQDISQGSSLYMI